MQGGKELAIAHGNSASTTEAAVESRKRVQILQVDLQALVPVVRSTIARRPQRIQITWWALLWLACCWLEFGELCVYVLAFAHDLQG